MVSLQSIIWVFLLTNFSHVINLLLTKLARDCTGRISALGLSCTDIAALGPYCQDLEPIFSQYGPRTWLIRYIYCSSSTRNWNVFLDTWKFSNHSLFHMRARNKHCFVVIGKLIFQPCSERVRILKNYHGLQFSLPITLSCMLILLLSYVNVKKDPVDFRLDRNRTRTYNSAHHASPCKKLVWSSKNCSVNATFITWSLCLFLSDP